MCVWCNARSTGTRSLLLSLRDRIGIGRRWFWWLDGGKGTHTHRPTDLHHAGFSMHGLAARRGDITWPKGRSTFTLVVEDTYTQTHTHHPSSLFSSVSIKLSTHAMMKCLLCNAPPSPEALFAICGIIFLWEKGCFMKFSPHLMVESPFSWCMMKMSSGKEGGKKQKRRGSTRTMLMPQLFPSEREMQSMFLLNVAWTFTVAAAVAEGGGIFYPFSQFLPGSVNTRKRGKKSSKTFASPSEIISVSADVGSKRFNPSLLLLQNQRTTTP